MKLGYIYTVTSGGYDDDKVRINVGDWSSIVEDERQLWQRYSVNGESIAMTLVRDGVVFAITRIIGGERADDNITTWVFIPSKIQITGSQIKQVIGAIKGINKVGTKKVTQETFIGDEILASDYPEKRYSTLSNPSIGSELGGRYPTTDFSMVEILGGPYQEYYTKYKYVFLFNQKSEFKEGLINLSNEDIIETICVLPPSRERIQSIFGSSSVIIKLSNGRVFNTPTKVKKGQIIDLIAEKDACIPIRIKAQAFIDEKEIEISTANQQWRRIISNNLLDVKDSKLGKTILSEIKIQDSQYNDVEKSLPENRLRNVQIRVTANGYEPFEGEVDLSHGVTTILLDKIIEKETYSYWTETGYEVKVTISGHGAKSRNPLQGYEVKGQKLVYIPEKIMDPYKSGPTETPRIPEQHRFAWNEFCYGIIFSILLSLIVWGGIKGYEYFFDNKQQATDNIEGAIAPIPKEEKDIEETTFVDQTIAYLDNPTGVWHRDSLIKYNLEHLFDALNNYEVDSILTHSTNLQGSSKFKRITDAVTQNKDKIIANKNKSYKGPFCNEGDFEITLYKYIDKLNKPADSGRASSANGVASKAAKNAQATHRADSQHNKEKPRDEKKGNKNGSVL